MPLARPDSVVTTPGTPVTFRVLDNDAGSGLTLVALGSPVSGSLVLQPDGALTYTPQAGFVGEDGFAYTVRDAAGDLAEGMVTLLVNTPPVARDDAAATGGGIAVDLPVAANDDDADGDALRLLAVTTPGHGSVEVLPDGTLRYRPGAGFAGSDSFAYTLGDGRGGTATATATVTVAGDNRPPQAADDMAATEPGVPVELDLLANDNDPDGDPLSLVGLTLPAHGSLAIEPGPTVTYVPAQGFAGEDAFTYTVADPDGATAVGEVRLQVLEPAVQPTFANGYRWRRRLVLPPRPDTAETATNFVLHVAETADWLKDRARGGRIESTAGHDLRFELEDGTLLAHELALYDGEAGRLVAWVRLPAWPMAEALRLFLYCGKPGLTAAETAPATVWSDYLAVWNTRTGADRSGRGRALSPSGVAGDVLLGDAGRYDGQARASRTDATFAAGHAALTLQAVVRADAAVLGSDAGPVAQGPGNGRDTDHGFFLRWAGTGPRGGGNRVAVAGFKTSAGDVQVESAGNLHDTATRWLAASWASGRLPELYLDGRRSQPSWAGAITGSAPEKAYDYAWQIPWLPASDADITVVNVPAGGITISDKGAPGKLLLLVAPAADITGGIFARDLRYRGVVLIGATFRKVGGGSKTAPSGTAMPGGHVMQISFDRQDDWGGNAPFLFLANIDFAATGSSWGDFLQTGTRYSAGGDNYAQWCDVYLQKIRVGTGHYGWTAPGDDSTPHSDFIQANLGGIRALRVADCDIRWGYQTFFARPDAADNAHPQGIAEFRRIVTRAMPNAPAIYGGSGQRLARYLTMTSGSGDPSTGHYHAHIASDWYADLDPEGDVPDLRSYFSAAGLTAQVSGDTISWGYAKAASKTLPVWSGEIRFRAAPADYAPLAEIGRARRVATTVVLRQVQTGGAGIVATRDQVLSGTTRAGTGGIVVGSATQPAGAGGWQGLIGEVRLRAGLLSAAWLAAEHANQSQPAAFYGVSDEEAAGGGEASPVALPLAVTVAASGRADLDVLARAHVPAGTAAPTLVAVSQPAHGLATIVAGRVRYSPHAGYLGTDAFTYTLRSGSRGSTARIDVTVAAAVEPPPLRSIAVAGSAALAAALATALPGDEIVLADGIYDGPALAFATAGTADRPVVLRAAGPLRAVLRLRLAVTGSHLVVRGLAVEGTDLVLGGSGNRLTACSFADSPAGAIAVQGGDNGRIDHCSITVRPFATGDGAGSRFGVAMLADDQAGTHLDLRIDHNRFHDFAAHPDGSGEGRAAAVRIGADPARAGTGTRTLIEANLFEACNQDDSLVELRTSDNVVRGNTVQDSAAELVARHGWRSAWEGNWIENGSGLVIHDADHRVRGNRLVSPRSGLAVMAGDMPHYATRSGRPRASATLLAGNEGPLLVGQRPAGGIWPALDSRIEAHVGPLTYDLEQGTVSRPTTAEAVPAAVRLTRSEVGPEAA